MAPGGVRGGSVGTRACAIGAVDAELDAGRHWQRLVVRAVVALVRVRVEHLREGSEKVRLGEAHVRGGSESKSEAKTQAAPSLGVSEVSRKCLGSV